MNGERGRLCARDVTVEADFGAEAGRDAIGRREPERVRPLAGAVGGDDHRRAVERGDEGAHVGRGEEGEIGHHDDRGGGPLPGEDAEGAIDHLREGPDRLVPDDERSTRFDEALDEGAVGRDEDALDRGALGERREDVLAERARELFPRRIGQHPVEARLPAGEAFHRHDRPDPAAAHASSCANARTSRASLALSARVFMIVSVPRTGIPSTESSSPRSTTIPRRPAPPAA